MKLFRVITILLTSFLLFSCQSIEVTADSKKPIETDGAIIEMPAPVFFGDELKYSMTQFLWRQTQFMRFRLNKKEKKMHQSAVFFMLGNAPNGEIVSWYSDKRYANGHVRVIRSYPIVGGYCRTYQAYIKLNGSERHMTNNACRRVGGVGWSFYK